MYSDKWPTLQSSDTFGLGSPKRSDKSRAAILGRLLAQTVIPLSKKSIPVIYSWGSVHRAYTVDWNQPFPLRMSLKGMDAFHCTLYVLRLISNGWWGCCCCWGQNLFAIGIGAASEDAKRWSRRIKHQPISGNHVTRNRIWYSYLNCEKGYTCRLYKYISSYWIIFDLWEAPDDHAISCLSGSWCSPPFLCRKR